MQTWLKRTLIATLGGAALIASIGAYSQQGHGWQMGGDPMAMRAHMLERAGKKLSLDATQQQRLATLADVLQQQRAALMGNPADKAAKADPRSQFQALIAGNTFDRTAAQTLVTTKAQALQANAPALITAAGDFFDSLRADQQQKLRDMLNQPHREHHERQEHRG